MKKILPLLLLTLLIGGCNRAIVHGRERPIEPLSRSYPQPVDQTFQAAKQALTQLGYEIRQEDKGEGLIRSSWVSTKATSHYTDLFDQKDYGTVGTYYRVELKVTAHNGKSQVTVGLPVKSLVPHQKSTYREERRVLRKIADLLRKDDFEMTNLGVD